MDDVHSFEKCTTLWVNWKAGGAVEGDRWQWELRWDTTAANTVISLSAACWSCGFVILTDCTFHFIPAYICVSFICLWTGKLSHRSKSVVHLKLWYSLVCFIILTVVYLIHLFLIFLITHTISADHNLSRQHIAQPFANGHVHQQTLDILDTCILTVLSMYSTFFCWIEEEILCCIILKTFCLYRSVWYQVDPNFVTYLWSIWLSSFSPIDFLTIATILGTGILGE